MHHFSRPAFLFLHFSRSLPLHPLRRLPLHIGCIHLLRELLQRCSPQALPLPPSPPRVLHFVGAAFVAAAPLRFVQFLGDAFVPGVVATVVVALTVVAVVGVSCHESAFLQKERKSSKKQEVTVVIIYLWILEEHVNCTYKG
ncbi:hypothetical protein LR48_Vigan09g042700 [Vigna angularis]|uniref:Uncharacterized protein n=1 Tax=Phaseolus angularis TaxID=3914 RepID=A0A0L9V9U1_PHAAN|nr:hypothetical protein LR48_Vigan09g042700 [Vigna angularis]